MKTILLLMTVLSCSSAAAIENIFKAEEEAKAKSPIVIRFRVTDVQYEQQGELLYTRAEAEVLETERGAVSAGDKVSIEYGSNFVAQARQIEIMEQSRMPGKAVELQLPRLLQGQTASGWFSRREDDGVLVPAAGGNSFETLEYPEILAGELNEPLTVERGQVARFAEAKLELRLVGFEWVSTCPPNVTCVMGGFFTPVIEVIFGGRYQSLALQRGVPVEIKPAETTIEVMNHDREKTVTVKLASKQ